MCDKYSYLYLQIPVRLFVFIFVFALFCQPKYIRIHIRPFYSNQKYLYLYSAFFVTPNIFLFVFLKQIENQIIKFCIFFIINKHHNLYVIAHMCIKLHTFIAFISINISIFLYFGCDNIHIRIREYQSE